jgi:nitrogenase molybdenum-iron protein alpha chain
LNPAAESFRALESAMSLDTENEEAKMEALIAEVLTAYPDKFAKRRKKHLSVAKPVAEAAETENALEAAVTECDVKSNIRSVPGVMTVRGCAYAGSKGVVWGPIKDMVHISHGPVGCGQYSWSQRRNY